MSHSNKNSTPPTNEEKRRKLNQYISSDDDSDDVEFVPFLVVEPVNKQDAISHSIFAVQKFAQCSIGSIKSAKKLRSGSLLLEVKDKSQYDLAMSLTRWVDVDVKVSEHRGLNSSRGVIRCRDLRDCSENEVLEALQSQKVTAARHIMTKKDGHELPTNTFILTFRLPSPPSHVTAAYLRIPVERYIPNPLRCYNCQRYGHSKTTCSKSVVCARCGQEGHTDTDCDQPHHCCNCNGSHPAYAKECKEWLRQRDITRLKYEKNISFGEAAQLLKTTAQSAKSYAVTVKTTQSVSTQTDLTWPITDEPIIINDKQVTTGSQTTTVTASSSLPLSTAQSIQSVPSTSAAGLKPQPSTSSKTSAPIKQPNKQQPANKPLITRPPKGSDDPIKQFNKFGPLNDMEVDPGPPK